MIEPRLLIRKNIIDLLPYSTARDEYSGRFGIFMDANESPYGNLYNRYPDPHQRRLKERLSQIRKVSTDNIFIGGNGSDEAIDLVFRIFCEPGIDNALTVTPTYSMYKVAAAINDVTMREVRLRDDFSIDVDAVLAAADSHSKLLFICSPNNPTGNSFSEADIESMIEQFRGIVVLDEAYIDFSLQEGFLSRLEKYPNLIVLQTLSKAWGMAGLRIGMAFARADIVEIMSRVKYPYTVNVLTQKFVLDRLDQLGPMVEVQINEIRVQRKLVEKYLSSIPLIRHIYPSDANFLLVRVDDPRELYSALIGKGIIVRDRSSMPGCAGCLRITVGTSSENRKLIETLRGM